MKLDPSGNLNQSNTLWRNVAIAVGIGAATLATMGAAGAFAGAGGAAAGGGAGAAGAGAAGAGAAGAGAGLGAGLGTAGTLATTGWAAPMTALATPALASGTTAAATGLGLGMPTVINAGIGAAKGAANGGGWKGAVTGAATGSIPGGNMAGKNEWLMPLILGAAGAAGKAGDLKAQSKDRASNEALTREAALLATQSNERDDNPYNHLIAQVLSALTLDRIANTERTRLALPAGNRYAAYTDSVKGGYEASPEMRSAADQARSVILRGQGTTPTATDPANAGKLGVMDLIALINGGGGAPAPPQVNPNNPIAAPPAGPMGPPSVFGQGGGNTTMPVGGPSMDDIEMAPEDDGALAPVRPGMPTTRRRPRPRRPMGRPMSAFSI